MKDYERIILAPFCAETVFMYHKLKMEGIDVYGFFDRNPLMENQKYDEVYIQRYFYMENAKVIICSDRYKEEIINFLNTVIGYSDNSIVWHKDIQTKANNYLAATHVDLDRFIELMPAQVSMYNDESEILKIQKYKRLYTLGAPYEGLTYNDFNGMWRKDNYLDQNGKPHIFVKRIELDVTTKCTLRCDKCGNMIQYFECPKDTPIEAINADYNRIMELIEWTDDLLVMGGETFLNRDLSAVLENIKANPNTKTKVGRINLVTNGTVIPDSKTLESLKDTNISVWISNYKEHSYKLSELVRVFQEKHIRYSVLQLNNWADVQQLVKRESALTEEQLLQKRKRCWKKHHSLCEGKFFLCAFTNSSYKLGAVPEDERNFVDIYQEDAIEKIYEYLSSENPLPPACSWCNGNYPESWENGLIPYAEQIKKPKEYVHYR